MKKKESSGFVGKVKGFFGMNNVSFIDDEYMEPQIYLAGFGNE